MLGGGQPHHREPLVPATDVSGVDHQVVGVACALELNLPERDLLGLHEPRLPRASTPRRSSQGAPGGGHGWPTDALACAPSTCSKETAVAKDKKAKPDKKGKKGK